MYKNEFTRGLASVSKDAYVTQNQECYFLKPSIEHDVAIKAVKKLFNSNSPTQVKVPYLMIWGCSYKCINQFGRYRLTAVICAALLEKGQELMFGDIDLEDLEIVGACASVLQEGCIIHFCRNTTADIVNRCIANLRRNRIISFDFMLPEDYVESWDFECQKRGISTNIDAYRGYKKWERTTRYGGPADYNRITPQN